MCLISFKMNMRFTSGVTTMGSGFCVSWCFLEVRPNQAVVMLRHQLWLPAASRKRSWWELTNSVGAVVGLGLGRLITVPDFPYLGFTVLYGRPTAACDLGGTGISFVSWLAASGPEVCLFFHTELKGFQNAKLSAHIALRKNLKTFCRPIVGR
jgi:hypothetical protein